MEVRQDACIYIWKCTSIHMVNQTDLILYSYTMMISLKTVLIQWLMKMVVTDLFNKFIIDSYILIHALFFFPRSPLLSKCQPFWVCDEGFTNRCICYKFSLFKWYCWSNLTHHRKSCGDPHALMQLGNKSEREIHHITCQKE